MMDEYPNANVLRQHLVELGAESMGFQMSDDRKHSFEVFVFTGGNCEVLILYRFYTDDGGEDCEFGLFKNIIAHKYIQKRIDRKIRYLGA